MIIGLLHPGAMGAAVGTQLVRAGYEVWWCRSGRSEESAQRAREAGLHGVETLVELVASSDVMLSICPPAAAEELASAVAEAGFTGVFVDANAISPQRTLVIAERLAAVGAPVIDGAIIGPPPGGEQTARLYLSGVGETVDIVVGAFGGTRVEPVHLGEQLGQASGLKMAFGSFQKASRALAAVSHATADSYGVAEHLLAEAHALGHNALAAPEQLPSVAARAWRWAPEMTENAEAFLEIGLPDELARATAAVLQRWNAARDAHLDVATTLQQLRTQPAAD